MQILSIIINAFTEPGARRRLQNYHCQLGARQRINPRTSRASSNTRLTVANSNRCLIISSTARKSARRINEIITISVCHALPTTLGVIKLCYVSSHGVRAYSNLFFQIRRAGVFERVLPNPARVDEYEY